jgi:hypothetical protein
MSEVKKQNLLFSDVLLMFVVCLCLYSFSSCKSQKQNMVTTPTSDTLKTYVLKYERGPCFGQCPVYSFYLLSDHTAIVNAKANLMDTAGWYFSNPDQESIVEILELLEPVEWWMTDLKEEPEIADLPHVSLHYFHPKGARHMNIHSRTTHSLENVFAKLNHLVSESIWSKTELRPYEIPEPPLTDLIVQLKDGVNINDWIKKYEQFGAQLKKRITPNQQYYLVSKHPDKGFANDFLQSAKIDPDVIDAQWDKPLQERDK